MLQFLHDHNPLFQLDIKTWQLAVFTAVAMALCAAYNFGAKRFAEGNLLGGAALLTLLNSYVLARGVFFPLGVTLMALVGIVFLGGAFVTKGDKNIAPTDRPFYICAFLAAASLHATFAIDNATHGRLPFFDADPSKLALRSSDIVFWELDFILIVATVLTAGAALIIRRDRRRTQVGLHVADGVAADCPQGH